MYIKIYIAMHIAYMCNRMPYRLRAVSMQAATPKLIEQSYPQKNPANFNGYVFMTLKTRPTGRIRTGEIARGGRIKTLCPGPASMARFYKRARMMASHLAQVGFRPANPLTSTDLDIDPNGSEGLADDVIDDLDSGEDLPGSNADTLDQAGADIDGDDEDQPDSDNPNDVGEDESLGDDIAAG